MIITSKMDEGAQIITVKADDDTTVSWTRIGDAIPDDELEGFIDGRRVKDRLETKRSELS